METPECPGCRVLLARVRELEAHRFGPEFSARNALAPFQRHVKAAYFADHHTHRVFAEFVYAADYQTESWDRVRRVIGKAEHLPGGDEGKANPR